MPPGNQADRIEGYDQPRVRAMPSSPSFVSPPLEEVALAVQFQPLAIDMLAAAEFSRSLPEEFSQREEQPSRPPMSEEFTVGAQLPFRFEFLAASPMPRLWFLTESGTRLIQLQADLIAYNWRRSPGGVPADEDYPRYAKLRDELAKHLIALGNVETRTGESLKPNWCEVTYINHIGPTGDSEERPPLDEVLNGVAIPTDRFLPAPEDANANVRFVIPGDDSPRGRLNVALTPGFRLSDGVPIWVLTMTARLLHQGEEGAVSVLNSLDTGHDWVVNGFVDMTSERMHELWGRTV